MTDLPSDPGALRDLDSEARAALDLAADEAVGLGHERVGTEHLLLGLLANEGSAAARALSEVGVTLAAARHKVAEAAGPSPPAARGASAGSPMTARALRSLNRAVRFSHARRSEVVTSEHLLLGVLDVEGTAGQVLRRLGVEVERFRTALADSSGAAGVASVPAELDTSPGSQRHASPLVCPSCGAGLRDHVTFHEVTVTGADRPRSVGAYGCARCGVLLGFAPG